MLRLIASYTADPRFLISYVCCAVLRKFSYVQLARVAVVSTIASITVLQVLTADRANNIATFAVGRAHEAALVTMWGFIACCTANLSLIWILGANW